VGKDKGVSPRWAGNIASAPTGRKNGAEEFLSPRWGWTRKGYSGTGGCRPRLLSSRPVGAIASS